MSPVAVVLDALSAATFGSIASFLVRLTVITAGGWLAVRSVRHASAAIRHRVALAALASALALPAASLLVPALKLPVLPAQAAVASTDPMAEARAWTSTAPATMGETTWRADAGSPTAATSVTPGRPGWLPFRVSAGLLIVASWIVSLFFLSRVLVALFVARRMVDRSEPVADDRIRAEFLVARSRLGLRRAVALRYSPTLSVPVVSDDLHPTLLLPRVAEGWSSERLRVVLTHELAHVARRDGLGLMLLHAATALFWFHPLVWALARRAQLSCEQACDDLVLATGSRASDYAEDLLAIAETTRGRSWLPAVAPAFARRSTLGPRLLALLQPNVTRSPASRVATLRIAAVALIAVVAVGSVRVVAAPAKALDAAKTLAQQDATRDVGPVATGLPDDGRAVQLDSPAVEPATDPNPDLARQAADETRASELIADKSWGDDSKDSAGEAWYDRARDRYESKHYAESARAYLKAASLDYRIETAFYNAACSFALAGKTQEALDALEHALDAGFDRPETIASDEDLDSIRSDPGFKRLGQRAMNTDYAKVKTYATITRYESLRSRRSSDDDAWRSVGIDLLRMGEHEKARAAFAAEYAIDSSGTALYNQACALSLAGQKVAALDMLERSIAQGYSGNPEEDGDLAALRGLQRFEALRGLARDLELSGYDGRDGLGSSRAALRRHERVAREHPELGRAWFNLGFARLLTGDAHGAIEPFRSALARGYRVATTSYNLACAHAQADQPDEAFRWLDRAQAAGMNVGDKAGGDDDLDPLRSDPRFARFARLASQKQAHKTR